MRFVARSSLLFAIFFMPAHGMLQFGEIFHLLLQVNDYVSDIVLCVSISSEKSNWSDKRSFIESDLETSESHNFMYTAPLVDGNDTLVPLVGFGLEGCTCSSNSANGMRIVNAQESASWEVPLFLMQVNAWETSECECPGSRYSPTSPELLNNQYMYDSMTGDQKKKFCNPKSYYDPLFSADDLTIMFVFAVIIVVFATFTNGITLYTRLKVSFDIARQKKSAELNGYMLNTEDQTGVMTTNIAITTVLIGLTEDTPQLILSCFFAAYKVADGGMTCLECAHDGQFCKLAIDPTADIMGMISSNPVAFYSVISSVISIIVTAFTIAYGIIATPADGFEFLGFTLTDPEQMRERTYGFLSFSKMKQKVLVALAFPVVYVLALLFPVNAVVYFKIRDLLHKDWTPSLVGFILGLFAITFFLYWLVPAAVRYIWRTLYNGELKEIGKISPTLKNQAKLEKAAPYIEDVEISVLKELDGLNAATLQAVKGIDVPTLKEVKGMDVPLLREVKGIDVPTLRAMKRSEPYVRDVDMDVLKELKDVRADTLKAVKGIDVPTLRAIKESGLSPRTIRAARGFNARRLKAVSGVDLNTETIQAAKTIISSGVNFSDIRRDLVPLLQKTDGIPMSRLLAIRGVSAKLMNMLTNLGATPDLDAYNLDQCLDFMNLPENRDYKLRNLKDDINDLPGQTGQRLSNETLDLILKIGPHRLLWHERNQGRQ